jgi:hypothetical protein
MYQRQRYRLVEFTLSPQGRLASVVVQWARTEMPAPAASPQAVPM